MGGLGERVLGQQAVGRRGLGKRALAGVIVAALVVASCGAWAEDGKAPGGMGHDGMDHGGMTHGGMAMEEYMSAMDRMQQGMKMPSSGNADIDFVRMMIPHHQAAVDMAQTLLKYGKDPELRKLAQNIVAAQNREIAQMKAWLAKHDRR